MRRHCRPLLALAGLLLLLAAPVAAQQSGHGAPADKAAAGSPSPALQLLPTADSVTHHTVPMRIEGFEQGVGRAQ